REAGKQPLLIVAEKVVAPLDRRPQCALPFGRVPGACRQERETLLEPRKYRGGRQELRSRRGQLDRKRKAIKSPADFRDFAVGRERARRSTRTLLEECNRLRVRQRIDRILPFAIQVERGAAGDG